MCAHGSASMCTGMCIDLRADMCAHMSIELCVGLRVDMRADAGLDRSADGYTDMRVSS